MVDDRDRTIVALQGQNAMLRKETDGLRAENASLREEVSALAHKITGLEKKLGRNSSNSSLPPSSDRFVKPPKPESPNRKARRALGRRPGKQPGTPGAHLAQVQDPDEVVVHVPETCTCCGADLAGAEFVSQEVRQVFEVPQPTIVVTEHRTYKVRCFCGQTNEATFPPEARAPACYGPRVRAYGLYLLARQHVPFERAAEAMADLFGVKCSTGFLDDIYTEGAKRLDAFLNEVHRQMRASPVVHFDETPIVTGHTVCT